MKQRLTALVVGAGLMGRWHCDGVRAAGSTLVGVCDLDLAGARRLAERYGSRAGGDLEELLAASRPDVVHVCTPLAAHRPLAEKALRAGCHVVVEKPLAASLEDTEALLSLAKACGRHLCPVHQLAFQRWVPLARRVGDFLALDYSVCSAGAAGSDEFLLNALVEEVLPHPLSLFDCLRPGCLAGARWSTLRVRPGELVAQARVEALVLRVSISLHGRPTRHELAVSGTHGALWADLFHGFGLVEAGHRSRFYKLARPFALHARGELRAAENLARRAFRRETAYPGLRALIRTVHTGIRESRAALTPEHIRQVARAGEAIVRSAAREPSSGPGAMPHRE